MSDDVKKVFITYEEFSKMADYLFRLLRGIKSFDYIVGIPRGGLPLAVHLSHNLNIPMVNFNLPIREDAKIILVDDVLDTGKTMEETLEKYSHLNPYIVVLHWKPCSTVIPDAFVKHTTEWIVYPWERKDEKPNREMYKHL